MGGLGWEEGVKLERASGQGRRSPAVDSGFCSECSGNHGSFWAGKEQHLFWFLRESLRFKRLRVEAGR